MGSKRTRKERVQEGGNECQFLSEPDYYLSLQFISILYFASILEAVQNNLNIFQINAGKTES